MRSRFLYVFPCLLGLISGAAHANWQYPGTYVGDGWYSDDGGRFTLSVRGGASYSFASIQNKIGTMTTEYYYNPSDGMVVSAAYYDSCVNNGGCSTFVYAGMGNLADLPAKEDYSAFAFAGGASIGWVISNSPQWRIEAGWDHVAETQYNASPLFEGELKLEASSEANLVVEAQSGGVQSDISTDIISLMVFHDFFDGLVKPLHTMIPYIGFGLGYADTRTTLNMSDLYGDLSESVDLQNFGSQDEYNVLQFYRSETSSSNVAGIVAFGFSYGLDDTLFFDVGARVAYVPKIKWALTNSDDTRQRDWFSAENLIYANVMLGLRFEF